MPADLFAFTVAARYEEVPDPQYNTEVMQFKFILAKALRGHTTWIAVSTR